MKNVYLVPHTHWDREWYFSEDTANVLLFDVLEDFLKHDQNGKMFLDGQWSLLDDFASWKPSAIPSLKKFLKNEQLACGPLYSQPDVFNSQGETTFRNFEIGQKVADLFHVRQLRTAYLPDTFGFNNNLPQIFKQCKIDYFVFWRGLPENILKDTYKFLWAGLDGSQVKGYCLRAGYYSLGMYYPYNKNRSGEKDNPQFFLDKLTMRCTDVKGKWKNFILPLGGDQAPFMREQKEFLNDVNSISENLNIQTVSNYDKILANETFSKKYSEALWTPFTGKIHRTIASSRYDIKQSFRQAEDNLYYLLEPLEVYYSRFDANYNFEPYKTQAILKPLLKAAAHDSLGGCNTDSTNDFQLTRLARVNENVLSQVDLIFKKLAQERNVSEDHLLVFNPGPFKNHYFAKKIIYSTTKSQVYFEDKNVAYKTVSCEEISLTDEPLYKQEVLISIANLKSQQLKIIPLKENANNLLKARIQNNVSVNKDFIVVKINDRFLKLQFKLTEDGGDSYDASPGKIVSLKQTHKISKTCFLNDNFYLEISSTLNRQIVKWECYFQNQQVRCHLMTNNCFENSRLSLLILGNSNQIEKSQHLAISNFHDSSADLAVSKSLLEYPAPVDINDGIISVGNFHILTFGTNEFYKIDQGIELVLYRTYSQVTRVGMKWRPTTSGLSWEEPSPAAQLIKRLHFNLTFSTDNRIKAFNQNKFAPYCYQVQSRNFIANKMTKFVVNNVFKPCNIDQEIIFKDLCVFISSYRRVNNDLVMRLANLEKKPQTQVISCNDFASTLHFKPYEIIEHRIKDIYEN